MAQHAGCINRDLLIDKVEALIDHTKEEGKYLWDFWGFEYFLSSRPDVIMIPVRVVVKPQGLLQTDSSVRQLIK